MSNFNDIIKNAYELGILLDGCGTDERYYTFGSYVDLCGASPKELMPKCCCCDNTSGDTGLADNYIGISVLYDNEWKIKINSEAPIASNLSLSILYNYTNSEQTVLSKEEIFSIKANSTNNIFNLNVSNDTQKIDIKRMDVSPANDNKYNYILIYISEYKLYYGTFPVNQASNIDENVIKTFNSTICKDTNDISFNIPAIGIKGIDDIEDEEEVKKILRDNAYDLIIVYDSDIKSYEIIDLFGENDDKFIYLKDINIDKVNYSILVRNDPDTQRNVYDTNTGPTPFVPINYSFNVK